MVSYSRRVVVGWFYAILTGTAGAGNAARVSGTGVLGQHLGPSIEPPVWEGIRGSCALVPSLKRVGIKFRRLFAIARHLHAWRTNRKRNVFDHSALLTSPFPSFVLNSSVRVILWVKAFHALSRLLFCSPLSCVVPVALAFALPNIIEGRIENGNFHLVTCIFHLRIVLLIFSYC